MDNKYLKRHITSCWCVGGGYFIGFSLKNNDGQPNPMLSGLQCFNNLNVYHECTAGAGVVKVLQDTSNAGRKALPLPSASPEHKEPTASKWNQHHSFSCCMCCATSWWKITLMKALSSFSMKWAIAAEGLGWYVPLCGSGTEQPTVCNSTIFMHALCQYEI